MNPHAMIDLETFGTTPGSAILTIGAVRFDPATGEVGETFYESISLVSSLLAGLTVDPDTVTWWRKQSPEAKAALEEKDSLPLAVALESFSRWLLNGEAWVTFSDAPMVWCKGVSFDFPLLAAAYRAAGAVAPWKFYNERDCRTLFKLCEELYGYKLPKPAGIAHSALDDARHQAEQVIACLRLMSPAPRAEAA